MPLGCLLTPKCLQTYAKIPEIQEHLGNLPMSLCGPIGPIVCCGYQQVYRQPSCGCLPTVSSALPEPSNANSSSSDAVRSSHNERQPSHVQFQPWAPSGPKWRGSYYPCVGYVRCCPVMSAALIFAALIFAAPGALRPEIWDLRS